VFFYTQSYVVLFAVLCAFVLYNYLKLKEKIETREILLARFLNIYQAVNTGKWYSKMGGVPKSF